jgi:hypothetical protein
VLNGSNDSGLLRRVRASREKAVFAALRDAAGTEHWTVLHSLGIAQHERQVEGEADFVIVAPDAGLLVIEVKSHLSVARSSDGAWRLGQDPPTVRGPFQQAQEAMHSIRDYLLSKRVELRDVPILHAVWFTGVRARATLPDSPEWHSWQVLDSSDLPSAVQAVERVMREERSISPPRSSTSALADSARIRPTLNGSLPRFARGSRS